MIRIKDIIKIVMSILKPNKKIGFLFGAGISNPAGLPNTEKITNQVLSGNNVMHHTDGNYYFGKPLFHHMGIPDEYVPRITEFLAILKEEVEHYYNIHPYKYNINYEDLYYIAVQIKDCLSGEYDNAAIYPLVEKINPKLGTILIGKSHETRQKWTILQIADEATKYIRDIVWLMLRPEKINSLKYLDIIKDASKDKSISEIDVCTLNNDRVLETYLESESIDYIDGFKAQSNELKIWTPKLYYNHSIKIQILKLHGSVDWFRFRPENTDWSSEFIGIHTNLTSSRFTQSQGRTLHALDHRPIILVGTHNKMLDYTGGIIEDLFRLFNLSLRRINTLIICGYSFGDRGINTKIIDWIYSSPDNRIIVIHDNPDILKNNWRGAISKHWDKWLRENKLKIIKKKIEDTNWSDIKAFIN